MAYNNGFPMNYQQMYPQYNFVPQQQSVVQQPQDNGILWVQGEAGAKSWAVAPNRSVMLMDSESSTFYIKSSDASGMPLPLRIFDYTERTQQPQSHAPINNGEYITRDEFEKRLAEFAKPVIVEEVKKNG